MSKAKRRLRKIIDNKYVMWAFMPFILVAICTFGIGAIGLGWFGMSLIYEGDYIFGVFILAYVIIGFIFVIITENHHSLRKF